MNPDAIRIRVLVENETVSRLETEHGLSYLVEADGKRGLFDTGATDMVLRNAKTLGEPIDSLDWIVLSHGHYDHTGGLESVLKAQKKRIIVFAHPAAFIEKFKRSDDGYPSIGIRMSRSDIDKYADIIETTQPTRVSKSITLTGEIPRVVTYETPFSGFVQDASGADAVDPIPDDLSVIINANRGCAVLLGCAHAGPVNTLKRVQALAGVGTFGFVAGGMHLSDADDERIRRTVAAFKEYNVTRVAPLHCSGKRAADAFRVAYGAKAVALNAGAEYLL